MLLRTTRRFERDLKRARNRGKDLGKLWSIVARLMAGHRLSPRHQAHRLSGDQYRSWECHIEPDWLLIWRLTDDTLVLVRTGSHADLFG